MLTVGSLFAGVGGFDLGLMMAGGFDVRWQCEISEWCRRILRDRFPGTRQYSDIRDIDETAERVDLICGGFPCQPVSMAGKRRGQDDERWLWPEFNRVLCLLRPRYALIENTAGLASLGMADVLGDLSESGYDAEWDVIPAAAVGAPHLRERIWILAYPASLVGFDEQPAKCWQRHYVLPEGINGNETFRREDRELVAMVPGVHQRVAADWWQSQSRMARSAHGFPDWMDRNHALGNAVVPPLVKWIGERIIEHTRRRS